MLRWTSLFTNRLPKGVRRKRRSKSALTRRLAVEALEDRRMLAVITVDSAADNVDDDGLITLREAIIAANADAIADATEGVQTGAGDDVIQFAAALNGATITLDHAALGPLDTITEGLEIDASALSMGITINGNDPTAAAGDGVRIFDIDDDVTLNNLTLTEGDPSGDGGAIRSFNNLTIIDSLITGNRARDGGGIYADGGTTTITDSTISGNSAGSDGGGIYQFGGDLSVTNSTISGNSAVDDGGGIYQIGGDLSVTNSTISENSAGFEGGGIYAYNNTTTITDSTISGNDAGSDGGGIYQYAGDLSVTNSTISGNSAGSDGGGIDADYGTTTITDSTISGNSAGSEGGGIDAYDNTTNITDSTISGNDAGGDGGGIYQYNGDLSVTNSTISGNSAENDGGGIAAYLNYAPLPIRNSTITLNTSDSNSGGAGSGGGLYLNGFMGAVTFENTIIAGNTDNTGTAPDIDNTSVFLAASYSLIGINTGSGLAPGNPDAGGNLIGSAALPIDPLLGDLMDNGGPTFTHALLVNSPAIDTGDPAFAAPPNYDQRGMPFDRVVDGDEDSFAFLDIGAFEFVPPPPPIVLGSEPTIILNAIEIFEGEIHVYQYTAHDTGKLIVRTYFQHEDGDIDLQVVDQAGNIIATSSTSSPTQNFEEIIIPVVFQERYFIHVLGVNLPFKSTEYDLEVENFPAPVPTGVHLDPADDTGMMNNDNVTSETQPQFFIQTDVLEFVDTNSNGLFDDPDPAPVTPPVDDFIDALSPDEANRILAGTPDPDDEDGGIAVQITLVNTTNGDFMTGFAEAVISVLPEVYRFTPDAPMSAGVWFVSARTKVFDGQADENDDPDQAMGRSNASPPLWITIQTDAPSTGQFDLLDSSDTGMYDDDNVTKKWEPAFGGVGPENAKVHVFAQANDAAGAPVGDPFLVGSGVVLTDLTDGVPGNGMGIWEVTVEPMDQGKWNFWARFENVSGTLGDPVALATVLKTSNPAVAIPDNDPLGVEDTITFAESDFALVGDVTGMDVRVADVNVTINITHDFVGDLDVFLISPAGTEIELTTDNGGSGNNYTDTRFDDAAGTSITSIVAADAPFTATFRPEQPLAGFFNETALGDWTLRVIDDDVFIAGTFDSWSLDIVTPLMVVIDKTEPNTPFLDLLDDTGRHDNDNITKDNRPRVSMTSTDPNIALAQMLWQDNLKFRIYDRFENSAQEVLIYDSAQDPAADAIMTAGDMFTALTQLTRTLPVLLPANPAITGNTLTDGVHNLKLEVEDRAGNISHDFLLEITIDTAPPPVSFGLPDIASEEDGLAASSDTGVVTMPMTFADRITSDTTPTLWGRAEADTIVRVYLDRDYDGIIDLNTDTFLGQTVALPFDGNDAYPDGYWELTVALDLNEILGIPKDGLRRLLVTAEDLAGNPMPMLDKQDNLVIEDVDELHIFIDTQGPQITDVTINNLTADDYDLFDPKPSETGPTPLIDSLKIHFRDLPSRVQQALAVNSFLYEALKEDIAGTAGNYLLVGDHVGIIPIESITVNNEIAADYTFGGTLTLVTSTSVIRDSNLVGAAEQPVVGDYILINNGAAAGQVRRITAYNAGNGQMTLDVPLLNLPAAGDSYTITTFAEATVVLDFFTPLPDDRYTLTVSDNLVDPANNKLDGESNADEPQEIPTFPSGDGVPGGDFVARFTVDSRAEIGTWAAGSVLIDTNGNFFFDPTNTDATNRDLTYRIGFDSDYIFAGKFSVRKVATGFDTIAAYGRVSGNQFRWLIDTDDNGVADLNIIDPAGINGYPVAGNFDGNPLNGDEVGLFDGQFWYFDTNHDFNVDMSFAASGYNGFPIVGDFDGDGDDDVATYVASSTGGNLFSVDINTAAAGTPIVIDGIADFSFQVGSPNTGGFGFAGVRERPVAADFNGDGIDDFGLWVPDGIVPVPNELSEWYLLLSGDDPFTIKVETTVLNRIQGGPLNGFVPFSPSPFGNDLYAQFGNTFSLPIAGNFDPPVASSSSTSESQAPISPLTSVTQVTVPIVEQTETQPVVVEFSEPVVSTLATVEQQPVEEEVVIAVVQVSTEVVPETPLETLPSKEVLEVLEVPVVERVVEESVETELAQATETEPVQSSLHEAVTAIVLAEAATPETPVEVVAKQVSAEPEPEVVAANESVVVKVTTEAQAEEISVALVDPPVPTQSRSRVRSLSYGGSRAVASVSTQSVPPPVVKPAEPQLPVAVEIVVDTSTSKEVLQAPVVEIATDLSTSNLPTSGTTKSIPNETATLVTLVLATDPSEVVGEDVGKPRLPAHGASSFPVSEQSKGNETDSLPQVTATDLNVSPSTSRSRIRTLIYVQAQSNYQTSPRTPSLATGNTADAEQLAYLIDLTDAAFDNASLLEFNRVDEEVVDELSRLNQDSTEEFESRIQHELLN